MQADHHIDSIDDEDEFDAFLNGQYPSLEQVPPDHPFLLENGIRHDKDMRLGAAGEIIIPLLGAGLKIVSFLFISKSGKQRFFRRRKILFGLINRRRVHSSKPVFIAKDYADAKAIDEATGAQVAVALTHEPIENFAEVVQKVFPGSPIVYAGTADDQKAERDPLVQTNLLSYGMIYPSFDSGAVSVDASNGFNALKKQQGVMEVRRQIRMKLNRLFELQDSFSR